MNNKNPLRSLWHIATIMLCMVMTVLCAGCATGPTSTPTDPLEPMNRATFRFNDTVDQHVAQPLARGYNKVVPEPIRIAVYNFFSNLGDVAIMANNFAQGRAGDGLSDFMRIAINTTFGIGGLIDIATPARLPKHDQDLGLTLGHWGVPSGPYLVLPLFGPSTFRDAVGFAGDSANFTGGITLSPTNLLEPAVRNSLYGVQFVSTRARYLGATSLLEEAALDKYTFTRDAYLGRRRTLLERGREESLPNYEEDTAPDNKPVNGAAKPTVPAPSGGAPAGAPLGSPPDSATGR